MQIKKITMSFFVFFVIGLPLALQNGEDAHAGNPATPGVGQIHHGRGVVESIDPVKGTVTMEHDPIASLKWPKMVMTFTAKNPALLEGLKEEDRVEFDLVQNGEKYYITRIQSVR